MISQVEHDIIKLPPLCYSEFHCSWACSNFVGASGLNLDLIINPTEVKKYKYSDT